MLLDAGRVLGLTLVFLLSLLSYRTSLTSLSGTLAGIILSTAIVLFGGWQWLIVFITFVIVGSIATRIRITEKERMGVAQEKKGTRGWKNAVANGLPAAIASLFFQWFPSASMFFASSLSSALADTLATEIGISSLKEPRLITNPSKRVPIGTSGGFTLEGYVAALLGALLISLTSLLLGVIDGIKGFIIIIIAGLIGSTIDSLIGCLLQAKYYCPYCGKLVETATHCGVATKFSKGIKWFDNHMTNLLSNSIAGFIGLALLYYFP